MCEYSTMVTIGTFIKDYASVIAAFITFFIAYQALQTWKKKIRFEYACKINYLVSEAYYKIKCGDFETAQKRSEELEIYFENMKLIYPATSKDTQNFIDTAQKAYTQKNKDTYIGKLEQLKDTIIAEIKSDIEVLKK